MDEQSSLLRPDGGSSQDSSQPANARRHPIKNWLTAAKRLVSNARSKFWKPNSSASNGAGYFSRKDVSYTPVRNGTDIHPDTERTRSSAHRNWDDILDTDGKTSLGGVSLQKVKKSKNTQETDFSQLTEENGRLANGSHFVCSTDDENSELLPSGSSNGIVIEMAGASGTDGEEEEESTFEKYTSCRWTLAYLAGYMSFCTHCLRTCISMAIVCIRENQEAASGGESSNVSKVMLNATPRYIPKEAEGVVLSSYFYGYLVTPFIFSVVLSKLGVKHVMTFSMMMAATLTLLTPTAIRHGLGLTLTVRVLLGIMAGGNEPCGTILWVSWAPQTEKAKLITLTISGSTVGILVANLVSGFLCSIPLDEGWPFIFYTYGTVTAVWVILWNRMAFDHPETHPSISNKELSYILKHRHPETPKNQEKKYAVLDTDKKERQKRSPPWRSIFTSVPFLALLVTHVAYIWIQNFMAIYFPLYVSQRLQFSTQESGVVSSLPFMSRMVTSVVFAAVADHLHTLSILPISVNRKLFQSIGLVIPSAILFGVGYLGVDSRYIVAGMIVVVGSFHAACISAYRLNYLDLSPRYAGSLTGIAQTFSNLTQILATTLISYTVEDGLQSSWIKAFSMSGAIGIVGAAVFVAFGSGDQQNWD